MKKNTQNNINLKKSTDLELVNLFVKGSTPAFEELIGRHESTVYNLAMRFVKNQEDAEEVLQDVFITLYRKLHKFEGKSAFSSWLYRITANAAFMLLRKKKQQRTSSLDDLPLDLRLSYLENDESRKNRSDNQLMQIEMRERLDKAINGLPEQYKTIFVLRDVDGISNEDVSQILNITIPAVKSRLHRARMMLRARLLEFYEEIVGRKVNLSEKVELEVDDNDENENIKELKSLKNKRVISEAVTVQPILGCI